MSRLITTVVLCDTDANKLRRVLDLRRHLAINRIPGEGTELPTHEPFVDYEEVGFIRQVQKHLTKSEIAEVVRAYQQHEPVNEIAARFAIRRQTVWDICKRAGVQSLPRGLSRPQIEVATKMYASGKSLKTIADELGFSANTVRTTLRKHGIALRPRAGA